jgi:hypothetical protein
MTARPAPTRLKIVGKRGNQPFPLRVAVGPNGVSARQLFAFAPHGLLDDRLVLLVPVLRAAVVAQADRDLDVAVDVASVGPLPKLELLLARDDAALLAEIALMFVVQGGHRPHRPLHTPHP